MHVQTPHTDVRHGYMHTVWTLHRHGLEAFHRASPPGYDPPGRAVPQVSPAKVKINARGIHLRELKASLRQVPPARSSYMTLYQRGLYYE